MLASTSAAIAAAKAERESLENRLADLKLRLPRSWVRLRVLENKIEAAVAHLAALEEAASAEEASLAEDEATDIAIVVGLVLSADVSIAAEVSAVRKQLRAMSQPEFLASVEATRAARAALANTDTVLGKYDRKTHENALAIAGQVATERGLELPALAIAAPKPKDKDRGQVR